MKYVDGFVLVVKKDQVDAYRQMAMQGIEVWMKHGALAYFECMGDELTNPMMGPDALTFPKLTNLAEDETVWFSFIVFKSKEHRDEVNKKVMEDPEMNGDQYKDKPMPFDMKRIAVGGFTAEVEAGMPLN